MSKRNFSILIVDDSATYRSILKRVVSSIDPKIDIEIAQNGRIALEKVHKVYPDLILLDVNMPEMDGLQTLRQLRRGDREVKVLMVSGSGRGNAEMTMTAISAGAMDFIPKPDTSSASDSLRMLKSALLPVVNALKSKKNFDHIKFLSSSQPERRHISKSSRFSSESRSTSGDTKLEVDKKQGSIPKKRTHFPEKIDVIALGVSTGGPNALGKLIPKLSKDLPIPILAVQHMPPVFTATLAAQLNKNSDITVVEGESDMGVEAGHMYIAPGGKHMIAKESRNGKSISITDTPPVQSCKPSVDVLFNSMAEVYGGNILSVILTGMGSDGANGVAEITVKGGHSIVQDEKSSLIWGMPGAVSKRGLAHEEIPLSKLADRINYLARKYSK